MVEPAPAASSAAWGTWVGEYQLAAEIASGGMGTVYMARRAGDPGQNVYAVKVVHPHLAARDPGFADMLRDEARLAAHVCHPNAVGVVDVGEQDGRSFAVMPYVEGGTLAELLAIGGATPGIVAAVMIDALRGLHAAHTAEDDRGALLKLVHRDVCPSNILVGVDGSARIADFGIAQAESRLVDLGRESGQGKCAFMSPEQLQGEPVDRRSDAFAAGITLFEALTGTPLFQGDTVAATMQNVVHRRVPQPSEVGARPPAAFDAVCARALARDPAQRFPSAEAMAVALRDAAGGAGALASREAVAAWAHGAMADVLAVRRAALASLDAPSADTRRSLPLPPPDAGGAASETLDELELNLDDDLLDDDDPDGPATTVFNPDDHPDIDGEIEFEDIEVIVEDGASEPGAAEREAATTLGRGTPSTGMPIDPDAGGAVPSVRPGVPVLSAVSSAFRRVWQALTRRGSSSAPP